jgi:hypothetical protein
MNETTQYVVFGAYLLSYAIAFMFDLAAYRLKKEIAGKDFLGEEKNAE